MRDVRKQYQRNHNLWDIDPEKLPVFGTIASQFNDPGTNTLYKALIKIINNKTKAGLKSTLDLLEGESEKVYIIPPNRIRYLSEITENNKAYDRTVSDQSDAASKAYSLKSSADIITEESTKRYCRRHIRKFGMTLPAKINVSWKIGKIKRTICGSGIYLQSEEQRSKNNPIYGITVQNQNIKGLFAALQRLG